MVAALTKEFVEYLKQEVAATKEIAQSAVQMNHDNKRANELLGLTMNNVKETLDEFRSVMDNLKNGYVTKDQFESNKELKAQEHSSMWKSINRLENGFIGGATFLLAQFLALMVWFVFQQ